MKYTLLFILCALLAFGFRTRPEYTDPRILSYWSHWETTDTYALLADIRHIDTLRLSVEQYGAGQTINFDFCGDSLTVSVPGSYDTIWTDHKPGTGWDFITYSVLPLGGHWDCDERDNTLSIQLEDTIHLRYSFLLVDSETAYLVRRD